MFLLHNTSRLSRWYPLVLVVSMMRSSTITRVHGKAVRPLHHSSRRHNPLSVEQGLWPTIVLGSDESGTGALAGPIVTATVACLDPSSPQSKLPFHVRDGKALTASERQDIYQHLLNHPLYKCTLAIRQAQEIDAAPSIQHAVNDAFQESITQMVQQVQSSTQQDEPNSDDESSSWEFLSIVDGKSSIPNLPITSRPWIKGDTIVYTIALASIVARVTRDRLVQQATVTQYPQYGFDQHGGYPSREHWHALHTYGPTPYHRRSCKLIRQRDIPSVTSSSSSATTASSSNVGTRSDFLKGVLIMTAGSITGGTVLSKQPVLAMYTDKKTGIQFPEVGEIAASIPTEWDDSDLDMTELNERTRFQRLDSTSDSIFYQDPRFVEHVDDAAVVLMTDYLNQQIVESNKVKSVLDLCSSWTSHLPTREQHKLERVAGLGMNAKELQANPSLTEWIVADLNEKAVLPYDDQSFDAVLCQLSIDYLTQPVQVCREMGRVLKPGGKVHILFSNRLFLQKAVASWTGADDIDHAYTVGRYLRAANCFESIAAQDLSTRRAGKIVGDPLYVVTAVRV